MQAAHERLDQETFLLVTIERGEACARSVVANVVIALIVDRAQTHLRLIDAIPRGEGVGACRLGVGPKKHAALHAERLGNAGHPERGGGEIKQAQHLFIHATGVDLAWPGEVLGPANNHRHVQAAVPAPVDATSIETAVVGKENDDGVFTEAILSELVENPSNAHVGAGDGVEVARPFLARDFVVGIIRRRRDIFRRGHLGMPFLANPLHARFLGRFAVVNIVLRLGHVDLREEGLLLFQVGPVPARVHGAFLGEIQIQFARAHLPLTDVGDVRRMIAGVQQQMRNGPHTSRQPKSIRAMAAHVMHVRGGGIPSGHQRRPARRAHWRGRIHLRVPSTLACEPIEVGCTNVLLSVAGEVEGEILANDPEDIWRLGSIGLVKGAQAKQSQADKSN